jgi:isopentenyl phosphate kinase
MNDREYIEKNVIPVLHKIVQMDWDKKDAVAAADEMYLDVEEMYYKLIEHFNQDKITDTN